jgi:DNA-binding GntR family transcriptional regulator
VPPDRGQLRVESIVDRVYVVLRDRIASGALPRGARLRQEALALELGVSRTPLREALRRLVAEGLVELEPNRGARVRDASRDEVLGTYEARLVLEPGAARLGALRGDAAAVRRMRRAIAEHRRHTADVPGALAANREFHLALVAAAQNAELTRFAEHLWVSRISGTVYEAQRETPAELLADADAHERICDAVERGDADLAERLTREHVEEGFSRFRAADGRDEAVPA